MAYFQYLALLLLTLFSTISSANQPILHKWYEVTQPATYVFYTTTAQLCDVISSRYSGVTSHYVTDEAFYNYTVANCNVDHPNTEQFQIRAVAYCPTGETNNGDGTCTGTVAPTCTPPQVLNTTTNTCQTPPNPCLTKKDTSTSIFSNVAAGAQCDGSCLILVDDGSCGQSATGVQGCYYTGHFDGSQCTSSTTGTASTNGTGTIPVAQTSAPPTNSPSFDCIKQGKTYGTVNGVTVCLSNPTAGAPVTTTTNTGTKTRIATDAAGSQSTITTTTNIVTNNNGSVTTTTTTTNTDGTKTTIQDTQDKKNFCEQNPSLQLCKESSFSGSCGGFQCNGDAVQCAIAQRAYQDRCEADESKQTLISKSTFSTGEKLLNGQVDSDVSNFGSQDGKNNQIINVPSQLSESGQASFVGQGVQNLSVSVQGKTINLEFSKVNQFFIIFGYVLLALSYMAAYRIIQEGI